MRALRPDLDLDAFFGGLAQAPSRVLLLDYDGTLAPFHEDRDRAFPYPAARDAVRDIQADGRTRVVIVSGRAIGDLAPLLSLDPLPELWGNHGWERRLPGGGLEPAALPPMARAGLTEGEARAREHAPHERVEVKPASVAVHVRGLPSGEASDLLDRVAAAWEPLLGEHGLEAHPFDGGVELRVTGRDKGTAIREILAEEPVGAAIAYLGDDRTDEDAFRALGDRGLAVLVQPVLRRTDANVWVRPPEELFAFLHRWRSAAAPGAHAA